MNHKWLIAGYFDDTLPLQLEKGTHYWHIYIGCTSESLADQPSAKHIKDITEFIWRSMYFPTVWFSLHAAQNHALMLAQIHSRIWWFNIGDIFGHYLELIPCSLSSLIHHHLFHLPSGSCEGRCTDILYAFLIFHTVLIVVIICWFLLQGKYNLHR
jgi:hypothetical protein